jgi:hypothetical protein
MVYIGNGILHKGKKMYVPRNKWTSKQVNFLIENWDTMSDEKIADALGRTLKSVRRKRERMQLKKASGRGIVSSLEKYKSGETTKSAEIEGVKTIINLTKFEKLDTTS